MIKWMLPVSDSLSRKEQYIAYNAKYHCFVGGTERDKRYFKMGKSLCGKYIQDMDYDSEIAENDIHALNRNLCKKCFERYRDARNKELNH